MTADEQRDAKQKIWFEFSETRERYVLLTNEAEKYGKKLIALADALKNKPEVIEPNLLEWFGAIPKLVEDIKTTRGELSRLEASVRQLGLGHMIHS